MKRSKGPDNGADSSPPDLDLLRDLLADELQRRTDRFDAAAADLDTAFGPGTAKYFGLHLQVRRDSPGVVLYHAMFTDVPDPPSLPWSQLRPADIDIGQKLERVLLRCDETRDADLEFLAESLTKRWDPGGFGAKNAAATERRLAARRRLMQYAQERTLSAEQATSELCRQGLLLAAHGLTQPQTVRLGHLWVVGDDGRRVSVRPIDLRARHVVHWFATNALRAATATLWEDPYPERVSDAEREGESVPLDEAVHLDDVIRDPISDLMLAGLGHELRSLLAAADLQPGELRLIGEFLKSEDWSEAGKRCGYSDGMRRKAKSGALRKLRENEKIRELFEELRR
jgi:hypothetical protein